MDPAVLRILDANFNRAREGLRVLEEHARFVLDDSALTDRLKQLRHELVGFEAFLGGPRVLLERDTAHDVGIEISNETERRRGTAADVATAAARRLGESLRCIEEYGKIVDAKASAGIEQLRYRVYIIEQDMLLAAPRRRRLREARLHVLLTESLCAGDWYQTCEQVLVGGADVLQLREKALPDGTFIEMAHRLRELTERHHALLVINDRPDVARLVLADGVHVGQCDMSVADARRVAGAAVLVGKSTHGEVELRAAIAEAPDYLAVGTMFASLTKPDVGVQGPTLLEAAGSMTGLPLVAIGGVTADNVGRLQLHRPFAVAVCQAVIGAADPCEVTRRIRSRLDAAVNRMDAVGQGVS